MVHIFRKRSSIWFTGLWHQFYITFRLHPKPNDKISGLFAHQLLFLRVTERYTSGVCPVLSKSGNTSIGHLRSITFTGSILVRLVMPIWFCPGLIDVPTQIVQIALQGIRLQNYSDPRQDQVRHIVRGYTFSIHGWPPGIWPGILSVYIERTVRANLPSTAVVRVFSNASWLGTMEHRCTSLRYFRFGCVLHRVVRNPKVLVQDLSGGCNQLILQQIRIINPPERR
jgi:hypothetical protein